MFSATLDVYKNNIFLNHTDRFFENLQKFSLCWLHIYVKKKTFSCPVFSY